MSTSQAQPQIKLRERLAYGFGDFANNLGMAAVAWFFPYYYATVQGVNKNVITIVLLVAMIVGAMADVAAGIAVDRTKTKYGKARPWILRMVVPYAVFLILAFSVPNLPGVGKAIWAIVTLLVFNIIYSFINTPYGILNSLITQDRHQRNVINLFRTFLAYTGAAIVSSATLWFAGKVGWTPAAAVYGVVAAGLYLLLVFSTKERVNIPGAFKKGVSVGKSVKYLLRNDSWICVTLFGFVAYTFYGSTTSNSVYYTTYVIGRSDLTSQLNLAIAFCFYVPSIIGALIFPRIIDRFGKRLPCILGAIVIAIGGAILFINPHSISLLIASSLVKGIGMAPIFATFFAMIMDSIEYGQWKTGLRIEGLTYSTACGIASKIGMGVGMATSTIGLAVGGYNASASVQPGSVSTSFWFMYLVLPIILAALMIICLAPYKVDKVYDTIEKDLQSSRSVSGADDLDTAV